MAPRQTSPSLITAARVNTSLIKLNDHSNLLTAESSACLRHQCATIFVWYRTFTGVYSTSTRMVRPAHPVAWACVRGPSGLSDSVQLTGNTAAVLIAPAALRSHSRR